MFSSIDRTLLELDILMAAATLRMFLIKQSLTIRLILICVAAFKINDLCNACTTKQSFQIPDRNQ